MSYCINPNCPKPADPWHSTNRICRHCGSLLVLQGRYRVMRLLGEGGFAKTYEVESHGQARVLKVLLLNETKAVALFKQEAEVLMQLRHPGVPRVEADGYFTYRPAGSSAPVHCLIMEKIDGPNLEQWLYSRDHQPASQTQAIDWLKQLASILQSVHQQQFFHRDIKPANIMLRPNGQVVLIDFGSVREVTSTYLAKLGVGKKGTVIASKGYTPPEQDNGHPVPQSDFFALGRTFVHLLTGQHPLEFYDALTDEIRWRPHAPQVSQPLADLLDTLMARLPSRRPASAEVVLQQLHDLDRIGLQLQLQPQKRHWFDRLPKLQDKWLVGGAMLLVSSFGFSQAVFYGYFAPRLSAYSSAKIDPYPTPTVEAEPPTVSEEIPLETRVSDPKGPVKKISYQKMFLARTLTGHSLDVRSLAVSPDSKILASGSFDGTIKLWDLETGELINTLTGHAEAEELVASVAISPDGKFLVSGSNSYGGTIKVWNLATGDLLYSLPKQTEGVAVVAVSADSKLFASGSEDTTIKLWDLDSGTLINTLKGHSGTIRSLAFGKDAQTLASGSEDTTIKLWNYATGELKSTLSGHLGNVQAIAFSPDGQTLASGSADNTVKLWNLRGSCRSAKRCYPNRSLPSYSGTMYSIAFSPDGQTLAGGGLAGRINVWDVQSGESIQTLAGHSRWIESVIFSPNGKFIVSGSGDSMVKLWQTSE